MRERAAELERQMLEEVERVRRSLPAEIVPYGAYDAGRDHPRRAAQRDQDPGQARRGGRLGDAARPVHDQVPGGRRRRAAARRRAPQPRGRAAAPAARAARPGGRPRRAGAAEARRRRRRRSAQRTLEADRRPAHARRRRRARGPARRRRSFAPCSAPRRRWPALGDEYISTEHLLLALADKASGRRRPAARPRLAGQGDRRGARPAPRHLAQPRGHDPGAGEVRPRPDRRGRAAASSTR